MPFHLINSLTFLTNLHFNSLVFYQFGGDYKTIIFIDIEQTIKQDILLVLYQPIINNHWQVYRVNQQNLLTQCFDGQLNGVSNYHLQYIMACQNPNTKMISMVSIDPLSTHLAHLLFFVNQSTTIIDNSNPYNLTLSNITKDHKFIGELQPEYCSQPKKQGIYLKLGQQLENLERIVPRDYRNIGVLQDSVPPLDYNDVKSLIQSELKLKTKDVFELFSKQAIAAASLSQVHRAILLENGHQVAIKIQYPFVKSQSKFDLIALKKIAQLCNYLLKRAKNQDIDLVKLFHTWKNTIIEQLDLKIQVENYSKMIKDYTFLSMLRNSVLRGQL